MPLIDMAINKPRLALSSFLAALLSVGTAVANSFTPRS